MTAKAACMRDFLVPLYTSDTKKSGKSKRFKNEKLISYNVVLMIVKQGNTMSWFKV